MASPLLSDLIFGSYLVYSPKGTTKPSVNSRRVRDAVKAGHQPTLENIVERLTAGFEVNGLDQVLGADVTLVPAPRSSVLVQGGLWPPLLIAQALVSAGLGREVLPCLSRTEV